MRGLAQDDSGITISVGGLEREIRPREVFKPGSFTASEAKSVIAEHLGIEPEAIDARVLFTVINALHERGGDIGIEGGEYVYDPSEPTEVRMAGGRLDS